ncbi:MAG: UDP-N-acetylmuramoyl-tripeptide--D-alanyl-D-alanine ligase [Thermomicrobiales bacterium]|nr:UDP-N-acetylmuramoyl-tripeptide--D-alanyl-D-alanine ligase [Thermomicrobiales bacterium]
MKRYTLNQILEATGGVLSRPVPDQEIELELERDSRRMPRKSGLFIALRGEHHDAHQFVPAAIENGAVAAIVARDWAEQHPEIEIPLILVDEPGAALQRWATWQRARLKARVVGITGSVGKTSAKESIAAVLSQRFKVFRSPGNFNNEVGLPLSILDCPEDAEIIVLEMGGAYAFGEITMLAEIARPSVGVVTNIYPVHLERMGSLENIAKTKTELVEAIPADGFVVLNHDDPRVRAMAASSRARVITYGVEGQADVYAHDVQSQGIKGLSFWVNIEGEDRYLTVPFVGGPGVLIAIVALAVGHGFGMDLAEMMAGLQDHNTQVRLLLVEGPNNSQIIDDTYNASTPSVLAALNLLKELPGKRRIAVLGEMRELGAHAEEGHRIIGGRAGEVVDVLVTFGELTDITIATAVETAKRSGRQLTVYRFDPSQREELIQLLLDDLADGDMVLIKGARGLEMERIVAALRTSITGGGAS